MQIAICDSALMELRSDWKRDVESIQERHEEKEKKLRSDMRQLVSSVRGVIDEVKIKIKKINMWK